MASTHEDTDNVTFGGIDVVTHNGTMTPLFTGKYPDIYCSGVEAENYESIGQM